MVSKFILYGAALLSVTAAWLPWMFFRGSGPNGFEIDPELHPGFFFIGFGVLIGFFTFLDKKWSLLTAVLFTFCAGGLGAKYYFDDARVGVVNFSGPGIYAMMATAVLGLVSLVFILKKPSKKLTAASA